MKVILYMQITANGFIAKPDDNTDWISSEDWANYNTTVQKTGAVIIGRKTYELIAKQTGFDDLEKVKVVVVSHNDFETVIENHLKASTPQQALELLKDCSEVIVGGGGTLNSSFMKAGLVDGIYLDVEPVIFGKGIPVFAPEDFECELELLETRNITKNSIQLHYGVKK